MRTQALVLNRLTPIALVCAAMLFVLAPHVGRAVTLVTADSPRMYEAVHITSPAQTTVEAPATGQGAIDADARWNYAPAAPSVPQVEPTEPAITISSAGEGGSAPAATGVSGVPIAPSRFADDPNAQPPTGTTTGWKFKPAQSP